MTAILYSKAVWNVLRAWWVVRRSSVRVIVASLAHAAGESDAAAAVLVEMHRRAFYGRWRRGRGTCLERSYGLARLLRSHGYDAELVIGVRFDGSLEDGHAWVELDGVPLDEPDGKTEDFREFLRAPERGEREDGS